MTLATTSPPPTGALRFLRDAPWANPQRLRAYALLLALAHAAALAALLFMARTGIDARGEPLGSDFVSFWSAGRLAWQGHAAAAYDPAAHHAAEQAFFGRPLGWYAFFYPPIFLLVCAPLGAMPYFAALAVWLASTAAALATALRALAPRLVTPLTLAAFPAAFTTVGHGQNAFLTAALLAGAALGLDRRPALAGALIGCLVFKPQLALLAPVALLLTGRWRALAAMAATSAALAVLATLAFGLDAWTAFLAETPMTRATLECGLVDPAKMQSVFAAVRVLGGGVGLAYAAQGAAALGALVALMRARPRDSRALVALISALACLTTPFLLDYDLTLLIVPIVVLAQAGFETGFRPFEITALAAAFLLAEVARPLAMTLSLPVSPLIVAALAAVLIRRFGRARVCLHKPHTP
jgi:alpha-1,2-mannosyltransferase